MVAQIENEASEMGEVLGWNVMFLSGERSSWWDWLTPKDWRHACAYGWSNGRWIIYDIADVRSRICVMADNQFDNWMDERLARATAIVHMETLEGGYLRARTGLWCVTAIKHLLGLRSSALRPKALFRDLVAVGGKVTLQNGRQGESPKRKR